VTVHSSILPSRSIVIRRARQDGSFRWQLLAWPVLASFVLVLLLTIPRAASAQAGATKPAAASPALAVVDAYMAAWNAHDAATAAGYMTDDVEYYDASTPAPQKGRDNARQNVIQAFLTAAPDCVWTRTGAPVVGKDGVAYQWTFKGTNTGPPTLTASSSSLAWPSSGSDQVAA
jgi:hypothetical protein